MSYTEIYAFDKEGNAHHYAEVHNAWRGAMAVWRIMEERHLPPYIPSYVKACRWYYPGITPQEVERHLDFKPTRMTAVPFGDEDPASEIWALADDPKVPENERIVLHTTFDRALVRKENIQKVIEAFMNFGGETSLPEQADILKKMIDDPVIIAVGWNQTSVSADNWANEGGYDEENDVNLPYNCLTGDKHFWVFDEMEKGAQNSGTV